MGTTAVMCVGRKNALSPVIILPGEDLNSATTLATTCALHRRRQVFVIDLPGQPGLSASYRPHHRRFSVYGRWFDEVVAQLCTDPAVIVGHSAGAAIALSATPSVAVSGLVLVNPLGLVPAHQALAFRILRLKWAIDPSMENSEHLLTYLLSPRFVPESGLIGWYSLTGRCCIKFRYPPPLPRTTIRAWAASRIPILVATGAQDQLISPDRLLDPSLSLLGTDVQSIPGCGHLALREAPTTIADLVDTISCARRTDS
ncbi:MAG: alpha/beta hydrolase [Rhodococcus sp. (in: high G+C Gram-positive bacteria)]|uniref:alpha/beta fold hydrolase n=1 Tax=Rhodococcus sp. TaxID=1831 RepID=UPI002ADC9DEC|nr:alpha/beta hydrolase [Rhodococcus sp. (in: high G+C Gram-positive bacteria)]